MKKLITLLSFLFISLTLSAQSPGTRYGGHFALGTSHFRGYADQQSKLLFSTGIAVNKQFTKNLGVNMNALVTSKGSRISGSTPGGTDIFGNTRYYKYEDTYRMYYVEVPLLPKLSFGGNGFFAKVFAGPSINFNLFSAQSRKYEDENFNSNNGFDKKYDAEVMEYAMVYGAGIDLETKDSQVWFIDLRLSQAMNSFGTINSFKASNDYFALGIGYLY
jgi:hypothetical protein